MGKKKKKNTFLQNMIFKCTKSVVKINSTPTKPNRQFPLIKGYSHIAIRVLHAADMVIINN